MSRKFFGTDGIRGRSNTPPMDAETALSVGMAAGAHFRRGNHRHRVVIGKDTRLSGYLIEPALTAGFIAMGMDVMLVGPMPTPAISILTRSMRCDLGVMISASHNKYEDNGIKFFDHRGLKLSDEVELVIERLMTEDLSGYRAAPAQLGRARRLDDAPGRYIEYVKQTFPKNTRLDGLKVVLDCANGAAYKLAPTILWELGAEVIAIGNTPDGFNINHECGSTHPQRMCDKVKETGADIGIALDGDADRLIVCNEKGEVVDGDQIMGAIAAFWQDTGRLKGRGIVATIMSNMGLEAYLTERDIKLIRTNVGDRYVIEAMREGGYNLGGEQSGHIVFNDYTTTGDGIVAALQVLALAVGQNKPVSQILNVFSPYPQILKNVRFSSNSPDPLQDQTKLAAVEEAKLLLGNSGRVNIRKSGTEPLIRIMVEGKEEKQVHEIADKLALVFGG